MATFKGLSDFTAFNMEGFLLDKTLAYVKAVPWTEQEEKTKVSKILGSKVIVQIMVDGTKYSKEGNNNFGEQLTIKVRGTDFNSYNQITPFTTEVIITDFEKVSVHGDYRNQLSIIGIVRVKPQEGGDTKKPLNVNTNTKT